MNPGALVADGSLWVAVPIALAAGLISFLSPCVLPLVPGYLGFIGGAVAPRQAAASGTFTPSRARLLGGVLLFIAGFTLVFLTVATLGGTVGAFFILYGDLVVRILGAVIIAMGLVFIGVFGIAQRMVRPQVRGNLGLIGAPLLGIALGVGWTPCIGPTLAVILGMAYDGASAGRGALLGLAYSLGLGIPFVLLTLGFGWATRSVSFVRRHIRVVNLIGGMLLVVLGILMVTGFWTSIMSQLQGVMGGVTTIL